MKKILITLLFSLLFITSYSITADEIYKNSLDLRNRTLHGLFETKIIDPTGKLTGTKLAENWVLLGSDGLKKKIFVLHKPENVKGTRQLTIENKGREDDQWVYLPDLQTSRRLSKSDQSKPAFGAPEGTLTNEDLEFLNADDFNCKLLGEETIDNEPCYIIEAVKKNQNTTQFSKLINYISKTKWIKMKVEFYNKKGEMVKLATYKGVRQVNGVWTTQYMDMKNLKTNWSLQYRVNQEAFGDAANADPARFTTRFLTTGQIQ